MKLINFNSLLKNKDLTKIYNTKDIISYEDIIFKNKDIFHYDAKEIYNLDIYTLKIYEDLIKQLTIILNRQFNKKYSEKNYEFLLGYWLIHYIQQAYYKYNLLLVVNKKFPNSFFFNF